MVEIDAIALTPEERKSVEDFDAVQEIGKQYISAANDIGMSDVDAIIMLVDSYVHVDDIGELLKRLTEATVGHLTNRISQLEASVSDDDNIIF